ncbi:MAG: ABC transporter ATP-binding protein [Synergistaceae bacterium]|nr:ABC transporter ATP-binding protein [Synergistaceae bacterium]
MKLKVDSLFWSAGGKNIVSDASLDVQAGEFVGIIGPNGSGKSSLLKCVYRLNKQDKGIIKLNENNIWDLSAKEFARLAAAVPQEMPGQFDFTVREIAAMGRYPHKNLMDRDTQHDNDLINNALNYVGMLEKSERMFSSLSGGEKQRTLIARAIAQDTSLLILDEPTNHLDIYFQIQIMDLIKSLSISGLASLVVMHDLNLAAKYCDKIYVMNKGMIYASGKPSEIITPELISSVYKVRAEIINNSGSPHIIFIGINK